MRVCEQGRDGDPLDYALSLMIEALDVLERAQHRGFAEANLQFAVDRLLIETGKPVSRGLTPRLLLELDDIIDIAS